MRFKDFVQSVCPRPVIIPRCRRGKRPTKSGFHKGEWVVTTDGSNIRGRILHISSTKDYWGDLNERLYWATIETECHSEGQYSSTYLINVDQLRLVPGQ